MQAKYFKSRSGSFVKVGTNESTDGKVNSITVAYDGAIIKDPTDLLCIYYGDEVEESDWVECNPSLFYNAYRLADAPFVEFMGTAIRQY